jgi:hypothetical protein
MKNPCPHLPGVDAAEEQVMYSVSTDWPQRLQSALSCKWCRCLRSTVQHRSRIASHTKNFTFAGALVLCSPLAAGTLHTDHGRRLYKRTPMNTAGCWTISRQTCPASSQQVEAHRGDPFLTDQFGDHIPMSRGVEPADIPKH